MSVITLEKTRRLKSQNAAFSTRSARRVYRPQKDPNFWLDSAADYHMCYDKALFHDFKPLAAMKTAETATGDIVAVEDVDSITFELNIKSKKIKNTITDVDYVPDLTYNLIAIDLIESKNCEINAKHERMTITDLDDNEIFMTGTRQHQFEGNSYTLDL